MSKNATPRSCQSPKGSDVIVLDTSVMIPLRDGDFDIESRVAALGEESVAISAITRMELENGVYRDPAYAGVRRALVDKLLGSLTVLAFDSATAAAYGEIVRVCGYSRRKTLDRMIGAGALVQRARLATLNPADFADIPGLQVEAWRHLS